MTDDLVARLRRVAPSCPQYAPYAHEAADEIERLRGLLRDSLVGTDPRWMTTDAGREWLLRVSEALGE